MGLVDVANISLLGLVGVAYRSLLFRITGANTGFFKRVFFDPRYEKCVCVLGGGDAVRIGPDMKSEGGGGGCAIRFTPDTGGGGGVLSGEDLDRPCSTLGL